MNIYYQDDHVTLYHGDCLELTDWLEADVLVTDPPYGIGWSIPEMQKNSRPKSAYTAPHDGIENDHSTEVRDRVLSQWGDKPGIVFGSFLRSLPPRTKQTLVWHKPSTTGVFGSVGGYRRDIEAIYLVGDFPKSNAMRTSVLKVVRDEHTHYIREGQGHPHSKPLELMERLIHDAPEGVIADPFAGSGSTLVAARNLGRKAIGVELEEKYCEIIANRLAQGAFDFA